MKKAVVVLILFSCVSVTRAEEIVVGSGEQFTKNVPTDETQTDCVLLAPGAELLKTGAGVWSVPAALLTEDPQATVSVTEGALWLTENLPPPPPLIADEAAEVILNTKAALWMDMSSVVTEDGSSNVSEWRDVRDRDASEKSYPYAIPRTKTDGKGIPPVHSTVNEREALDFTNSGNNERAMTLRDPSTGSQKTFTIKHLFCVLSFTYYNQVRSFVGVHSGTTPFAYNNSGQYVYTTFDANSTFKTGQCYLNGVPIDSSKERVKKGSQLIDFVTEADTVKVSQLFAGNSTGWGGGGYYHEAIFFTETLTPAEHAQVRAYLMNKWGLSSRRGLQWTSMDYYDNSATTGPVDDPICDTPAMIRAAAGTTVLFPETSVIPNLTFGGIGQFHFLGSQQLFPKTAVAFNGELRIDNQLRVRAPVTLAVEPKDQFAFTTADDENYYDTVLTRTSDAADETVTMMGGEASVREVPQSVKRLEVSSGTLHLAVPSVTENLVPQVDDVPNSLEQSGDVVKATIQNPSFEEATFAESGIASYKQDFANGQTKNGWTAEATTISYYSHSRAGDNTWASVDSPDGDVSLGVIGVGKVWTTVVVPAAGRYRFSFKAYSRSYKEGADSRCVNPITFSMGDEDGSNMKKFGLLWLQKASAYRDVYFLVEFPNAGNYRLHIGSDLSTGDALFVDDLDLVKVAELPKEWMLPNGNFETFSTSPIHAYPQGAAQSDNWTFNGDDNFYKYPYSDHKYVGAVRKDATMLGSGNVVQSYYDPTIHSDEDSIDGEWALLMCTDKGSAQTTFTPPVGTYLLKAQAKSYRTSLTGSSGRDPASVKATITIGETTLDLGAVDLQNDSMETVYWLMPITVDGSQSVTLTLMQQNANATAVLDNLRLTKDLSPFTNDLLHQNFIQNGSVEETDYSQATIPFVDTPWVKDNAVSDDDTKIIMFDKKEDRNNYLLERGEGYRALKIHGAGCYEQQISLPIAGTYELSFMASSRYLSPSTSGRNPIRAYLKKGDVVQDIATVAVTNTKFVTHRILFNVTEAGDYTFGICGTSAGVDRTSNVDAIKISLVSYAWDAPKLHKDLALVLRDGSHLALDYSGTQEVASVRINGQSLKGIVNAETCPDFVSGTGSLVVKEKGFLLIVR